MPIRINLLAEQQAAEDLRRRDPVKRAIYAAVLVVVLTLAYSGSIQLQVMNARSNLANETARWEKVKTSFGQVTNNQAKIRDVDSKLIALQRAVTNRFLWAPALDALKETVNPNIHLTKMFGAQTYQAVKAVPGTKEKPGKPAKAIENIAITIEGRIYGDDAESTIGRYVRSLQDYAYFKSRLTNGGVNLGGLNAPQQDESDKSKTYRFFNLELRYPARSRE